MPKYNITEAEQTRSDMKYRRILVCYLNSPDFVPKHLVSKCGTVKRRSKDRIILTWDEFKHTIENFKKAGDPEDEVKIYETTCLTGLSFDLMDCPEINHEGAFDQIYLARWFFDTDTWKYNLKVLRLYEHMTAIDKDLRFTYNLERLTTGHIFDGALEKSKERLELLEKKWKIGKEMENWKIKGEFKMKELKVVETESYLNNVDGDKATPVKSYSVDIIERLAEKHNMTVEQVEEFFKDTQEEVVAALNLLKDYKDESDPEKFYLAKNSVGIPYLCAFKINAAHLRNGDFYGINVACGLNIVNGVNVQKRQVHLPDDDIPETPES